MTDCPPGPLAAMTRKAMSRARTLAQAQVEANMIAHVKISRSTDLHFDRATGELVANTDDLVWDGVATINMVQGPVTYNLGDEPQFFSSTYVHIPMRAAVPRVDDIVEVVDDPDPALIGRLFRIQDVEAGGQIPTSRKLQVVGIQPSREWS